MSHDLPHVASVVGRVSESIVELPIVILGGMSTRLVMHLPVNTLFVTRRGSGYQRRSRAGGCQNQLSDLHLRKN
jgi:hypothetical protein